MDIMKKAAVDVDMHIALWTERPRLGPATWQQAELYWLTPAPLDMHTHHFLLHQMVGKNNV